MTTGGLSSQIEIESANTSVKQQMLENLQTGKEYRFAFVEEAIRARLTAQIRALRDQNGWDYKRFSEEIGKKVSWAYRLEDPNEVSPTIPTLLQVAQAFDVGLDVRFLSFSKLLEDVTTLREKSFKVPDFDEEVRTGCFSKTRARRKFPNRRLKDKRLTSIKGLAKGHHYPAANIVGSTSLAANAAA
jgi:transcriptional regulator with XRE-family HTH domain